MIEFKFKGERLKKARTYRSMTLTDLAEKTNLTKQALSQYENGTTIPAKGSLFALSTALNFPVEYFSTPASISCSIKQSEATYFRSLMSTTKKDRLAQGIRLEYIAQIYGTLLSCIDFPQLNLPDISFLDLYADESRQFEQIEQIALSIRQFWNLDNEPINNLRHTIEKNGIIITCSDLNAKKIDAFSQRIQIDEEETFFIVISKGFQTISRARFDMAHELAHILLHPWSEDLESISKDEFKTRERQANALASSFLLPQDSFGFDIAHYPTNLEYYLHLKNKWHISVKAMIYRTHKLGIISINQFQYLMRQYSKNGWNSGEPDDQIYSPEDTLLKSAVTAILENKIMTPSSLLTALRTRGIALNPAEIEDLLCLDEGTLADYRKSDSLLHFKPKGILLTDKIQAE